MHKTPIKLSDLTKCWNAVETNKETKTVKRNIEGDDTQNLVGYLCTTEDATKTVVYVYLKARPKISKKKIVVYVN